MVVCAFRGFSFGGWWGLKVFFIFYDFVEASVEFKLFPVAVELNFNVFTLV